MRRSIAHWKRLGKAMHVCELVNISRYDLGIVGPHYSKPCSFCGTSRQHLLPLIVIHFVIV